MGCVSPCSGWFRMFLWSHRDRSPLRSIPCHVTLGTILSGCQETSYVVPVGWTGTPSPPQFPISYPDYCRLPHTRRYIPETDDRVYREDHQWTRDPHMQWSLVDRLYEVRGWGFVYSRNDDLVLLLHLLCTLPPQHSGTGTQEWTFDDDHKTHRKPENKEREKE